jgi:glutaredoxin
MKPMKQQCHVAMIYVSWAIYAAGLITYLLKANYPMAVLWFILVPAAMWAYIRVFPRISAYMGYGTVDDERSGQLPRAGLHVTLYSALGCPFCPIVEQRLLALQREMGFTLEKVDITLKPQLLARKKIQTIPVVEIGGHRVSGNVTSNQLAALIASHNQPDQARSAKA